MSTEELRNQIEAIVWESQPMNWSRDDEEAGPVFSWGYAKHNSNEEEVTQEVFAVQHATTRILALLSAASEATLEKQVAERDALIAERDALREEIDDLGVAYDRMLADRRALLNVTSTDGLLSSEWLLRTAEERRDKAEAENAALRAALAEVTTELTEEIRDRYPPGRDMRPDESRKFDRDMEPVERALDLLYKERAL